MITGRRLDWSRDTDRVQAFELDLHGLLESGTYRGDDRRLARVYLSLARLAREFMTADQESYLNLIERWGYAGAVPAELLNAPAKLSALAVQSEAEKDRNAVAPFLYRLLESCARPNFTIYADSDVEPIGWTVATGVPFEQVKDAVLVEYPELRERWS